MVRGAPLTQTAVYREICQVFLIINSSQVCGGHISIETQKGDGHDYNNDSILMTSNVFSDALLDLPLFDYELTQYVIDKYII